jgi:hypothetical protein
MKITRNDCRGQGHIKNMNSEAALRFTRCLSVAALRVPVKAVSSVRQQLSKRP